MADETPVDVLPAQPIVDVRPAGPASTEDDAARDGHTRPTPVAESERIIALDALRGFALLGILVMNIQSFAMIDAAYSNPTSFGDFTGGNYWVWLFSHLLADQKFITIFSMLFGAGIVLMTRRQEQLHVRPARIHYRRMLVLAVFGLVHAYLFWSGDILFCYALCGMLVYPLREMQAKRQIFLGLGLIVVPSILLLVFSLCVARQSAEDYQHLLQEWQPAPEKVVEELAIYRGTWLQVFQHRWQVSLMMEAFLVPIFLVWRVGGLMLVGMACFKLGLFSARASLKTYVALIVLAACAGVPLILLGVHYNFESGWSAAYSKSSGSQYNYWGSILVSFGWTGAIMLLFKQAWARRLMRPLAAIGQMALTNYLMHTLICTTLFYGYGLGWFGYVDRVGQIEIVFIIWALQLVVSPIWLHSFRFGPAEWLWRGLTYRHFPVFRRRAEMAPAL
jgi:uncharacterized protein